MSTVLNIGHQRVMFHDVQIEMAHGAGVKVSPVPGPNAAAVAVSVSGFSAPRFLFYGFLPASASARRKALDVLDVPWPLVLYEAPHRIARCLADLHERFGGAREIVICRELTKKFEEIARMPLADTASWLSGNSHREQGEFVMVLAPGGEAPRPASVEAGELLAGLLEGLRPAEAAKLAARITGLPKNELYEKALALRNARAK